MTYIALTNLPPKYDANNLVVKIGRSKDPWLRIVQLRQDTTSPYGKVNYALLCASYNIDEGFLHERYAFNRYYYDNTKELFELSEEQVIGLVESEDFLSAYDYNLNGDETLKRAKEVLISPDKLIPLGGESHTQPTTTKDGRRQTAFKLPNKTIEQIRQVSYWERIEQWKFVADAVDAAYCKLKNNSNNPLPTL